MSEPTISIKKTVSFKDTTIAFEHLNDGELNFSYFIFRLMGNPFFVKVSSQMALISLKLHLPVEWVIKASTFRQFCGGETIDECKKVVQKLSTAGIGAILDYSVEGQERESDFDETTNELLEVVELAGKEPGIPIGCMKVTGIARFKLLEKVSANETLSSEESDEYERVKQRLQKLCQAASDKQVPLYIDAEETWIQVAIDQLAEAMIKQFNGQRAIVFTTLQMYRHDRLSYFHQLIEQARTNNYILGVKIVRGAYLEKENRRAEEKGYTTFMQSSKPNTDKDYNAALALAIDNIDQVEICAGTHNEDSCKRLVELMAAKKLPNNHGSVYFSQLYGMSDYLSYNLSKSGYNVTKYLPYGPVKSAIPYLIRRAQENTAIAGQMGKELKLIVAEKKRRKANS